jgi:putative ABC transport system permease protein
MIRKYILITFRQIWKDKTTSFLNLAGLATGISTFLLLFFYLHKERSYDRYHNQSENIYRIALDLRVGAQNNSMAWTSGALAPTLQDQFAAVEQAVRLFRYRSPSVLIEKETNKSFSEDNFIWADSNVFNVFAFGFVKGDPNQALVRPNTVVISESVSRKYFGDADPIGKVITNVTFGADFEVTGVVRDMPANSHFKADLICSLNTLPKLWGDQMLTTWGNNFLYSYIKITSGTDPVSLENKINVLLQKNLPPSNDASYHFFLQPVTDIHLHSNLQNEWQPNSDIRYIYILTFVAILILLVSAINYINLWIARSEHRTKEIGIRQAIGSGKTQLASQFIVENLMHGIFAFLMSIVLVGLFLPVISNSLGEDLHLVRPERFKIWLITGAGIFLLMLLITLYPIQTILRIKPATAIRGTIIKLRRGIGLWYSLIAFQIIVTTMLITGALLINRQLTFIRDTPIGYDADRLLNITLLSHGWQHNYEQFKNTLLQNVHIKSASACSHLVGGMLYQSGYVVYKDQKQEPVMWQRIHADHDFCKTYGIAIVSGRDFSKAVASDTTNFIINETACRHLGLKNPDEAIGLEIGYDNNLRGKIVGVMKDFHFKTLHSPIEPLIIHIVPDRFRMLTLNVDQADFHNTITWIKTKWDAFDSSVPFVYTLLGDFNERNYIYERKFSKLIIFFTLVVFMLSATGLIGLNIYVLNMKRKEIGIRKILGAGISTLWLNLSKPFALITLTAFALSVPISWYSLTIWLSGFAYKVNLSMELFITAGLVTFILSMVSITFPLLKAAVANPASVLRDN